MDFQKISVFEFVQILKASKIAILKLYKMLCSICRRYITSAMGCTGAARPNFMCCGVLFQKSDKKVTFELSNEKK